MGHKQLHVDRVMQIGLCVFFSILKLPRFFWSFLMEAVLLSDSSGAPSPCQLVEPRF